MGADRRRAAAHLRDRGQQPHRARRSATCRSTGSCSSTRPTASATCAARPSRCWPRAPTSRSTSSTAATARAGWPARSTSSRSTRSTSSAGTAASTRTRSTSPTSSRSPAGCTSRRRCTRSSRAHNFVICNFVPRKVDYHPLAVPVPYYHSNVDSDEVMFYVDGDYEARKGSGIGKGSISLHPGGHSHGPQPGAVERSLGAESFDELAVMVDTFRPLALGEGGTAVGRREVRLVLVGPRARCVTWLDLPPDTGFGLDNLPLGIFSTAGRRRPRTGVRIGDLVLDLWAWSHDDDHAHRLAQRVPGPRARSAGRSCARTCARLPRTRPHRDARGAVPRADRRRHHAPAVRGRRLRRLLQLPAPRGERRPDVPPGRRAADPELEAPADRLPRPRRHGPGVRARRWSARAGSARRPATTSRPSARRRRLDIEAEVGFVVGTPSELGSRCRSAPSPTTCSASAWSTTGRPATCRRGSTCRSGPFLGKSFLTSVSPWVVPLAALEAARVPPPPATRAAAVPATTPRTPWGLDIALEVRLNGEVVSRPPFAGDVLDRRPAARAPDGQRGLAAHRRPVRLGHGQRPGARPARLAAGALLERAASR